MRNNSRRQKHRKRSTKYSRFKWKAHITRINLQKKLKKSAYMRFSFKPLLTSILFVGGIVYKTRHHSMWRLDTLQNSSEYAKSDT